MKLPTSPWRSSCRAKLSVPKTPQEDSIEIVVTSSSLLQSDFIEIAEPEKTLQRDFIKIAETEKSLQRDFIEIAETKKTLQRGFIEIAKTKSTVARCRKIQKEFLEVSNLPLQRR